MTVADGRAIPAKPPADINSDLGLGAVVTRESRRRLLNRHGTFNVRREGLRFLESLSTYHYFLTISWPKFLGWVTVAYVVANSLFAAIYLALGPNALSGGHAIDELHRFAEAFFFSVHTLATIGYGTIAPATIAANVVVTIEALLSVIGISLIAGIVFARFARPTARIRFSRYAVIGPYRGGRAFMFRLVNTRTSEIVDLKGKVLLARRKRDGVAGLEREFIPLELERDRVAFFPLAWTVVHPIDPSSPLWDWNSQDLQKCDAEFMILLNGFDETFSQTVHARTSYKTEEIVWGARFQSMFNPLEEDEVITIDIGKLDNIEPAEV